MATGTQGNADNVFLPGYACVHGIAKLLYITGFSCNIIVITRESKYKHSYLQFLCIPRRPCLGVV